MKKTHIILHSFMQDEMKLSGVTLMVYALIYSFTVAGSDCHGSLNYIAGRVDSSVRSVQRALKELINKGYVIKLTNYKAKSNHYLADMDVVGQPVHRQNDYGGRTERLDEGDKRSNDNKEDNKEDNKIITNTLSTDGESNPSMQYFGKDKLVRMTLHQYVNLLRAFGVLPTIGYIRELAEDLSTGIHPANPDHYREIISRATDDGRMTFEGRKILLN